MVWQTIGFKKQKEYFAQLAKSSNLAHAYLFSGPEMIGKQMFAREAFTLANNREMVNDPDLKIITPQTEKGDTKIYIEDIRSAQQFLSLKPYYGPYKFVIINDADRLTPEASNGLLKILEEPAPHSVIVLISAKPKMLLTTVISRCQEIRFAAHPETELAEFLSSKKIVASDRALLLSMAQGRIGWLAGIDIKEVRDSVADLEKILKSGLAERMLYAKKVYEKETYPDILANWIYWLYGNRERVPQAMPMLRKLSAVYATISQPQYNHRLALENAFITL